MAFGRRKNVTKPSSLPCFRCCQSSSPQKDTGGLSTAVEAVDEISHRKCVCSVCLSGCFAQPWLPGWVHTPRSHLSFKFGRKWDFVVPAGRELLWWGDILGVPGVLEGLSHVVSGGFMRRRKWCHQSAAVFQSSHWDLWKTTTRTFSVHGC